MYLNYLPLLLSIFFVAVKGKDGCKVLDYLPCIKNKVLKDHVIKSLRVLVPGLEECQNKCFNQGRCVSYNLGPVEGQIRTCELNDADHWICPTSLVSKEGSEFCPIQNHCSSNPCPAEALCRPDFALDSFICIACDGPLGMEDKRITDSQISASSFYSSKHVPIEGRLNNVNAVGSWSALHRNVGEYMQVDLLRTTRITKVATQGRANIYHQWVTKYSLSYSGDKTIWSEYDENKGVLKVFSGNTDINTIVTNKLAVPIKARYIRVVVQEFNNHPSMRMELYGCD